MQQAHDICLTIDLWSSRQMRGYLGVTVHYLRDWTMQTAMLVCKRFRGSHTGENISKEFQQLVEDYDVSSKVSYIVTDNASNMKQAFSFPGYSLKRPNDDDSDYDDCGDSGDELEDEVKSSEYDQLPQRISCFNHTLNLCVNDGLKVAGQLKSTIGKAAKIVSHVRRSILASDKLENECRLQTACPTRWNSQLYMIQSVLSVGEEKLNEASPNIQLSKYERNILEDLVQIFKPFELATKRTQQNCYVSSSLVIPCVRGLKSNLSKMKSRYNCKMVLTLVESVDRRLSVYEENESFMMASILDPRYKAQWCKPTETEVVKSLLLEKASAHNIDEIDSPKCPPSKKRRLIDNDDDDDDDDDDMLFDFMNM